MLATANRQNHLINANHSSSSADLRPSRKFMSMVNKMRTIDRRLHLLKATEDSEKQLLSSLIYRADRIESRTKRNITKVQNIIDRRPRQVDVANTRLSQSDILFASVRNSHSSHNLQGMRKEDFFALLGDTQKLTPVQRSQPAGKHQALVSSKSQKQRPTLFPEEGYKKIDNVLNEALEDLNQSDIMPLMSRSRREKTPRRLKQVPPVNKVRRRTARDELIRHKMLSVLILLTGLIIIISML